MLKQMPKGALLHSHLDAMVNAADLLKIALEEPAMHVKVSTRLTASSLASTLPTFRGLNLSEFSDELSITSSTYVPVLGCKLGVLARIFPLHLVARKPSIHG